MSIYNFLINDIRKKPFDLASYAKGNVLVVVNVASQCGFTPQYDGLEKLHKKYFDKGLRIIGVPTNDFKQEPKDGEELVEECRLNYGVTFPIMEKVHVNGPDTHPLYAYLKKERKQLMMETIKWNFEKFLVARNGTVVERFASTTTPEGLEPYITAELEKSQ